MNSQRYQEETDYAHGSIQSDLKLHPWLNEQPFQISGAGSCSHLHWDKYRVILVSSSRFTPAPQQSELDPKCPSHLLHFPFRLLWAPDSCNRCLLCACMTLLSKHSVPFMLFPAYTSLLLYHLNLSSFPAWNLPPNLAWQDADSKRWRPLILWDANTEKKKPQQRQDLIFRYWPLHLTGMGTGLSRMLQLCTS